MRQNGEAFSRERRGLFPRWAIFDLIAVFCCVVLLAASLTATVRLGAGPQSQASPPEMTAAAIAPATTTELRAPQSQKHCPRSGARHALMPCAAHVCFVCDLVTAEDWVPPSLVVTQPALPADDAFLAQWHSTPPHRPPRFAA